MVKIKRKVRRRSSNNSGSDRGGAVVVPGITEHSELDKNPLMPPVKQEMDRNSEGKSPKNPTGGGRKKKQRGKKAEEKVHKRRGWRCRCRRCCCCCYCCCCSREGTCGPPIDLDEDVKRRATRELNLTKDDFEKLEKQFRSVDKNSSGDIDVEEFLTMLDETDFSPQSTKLFDMIDVDGSLTISFTEWVAVMLTFCCYTKADILRFSFESAQIYKRGFLVEEEVRKFLKDCENVTASSSKMFHEQIVDQFKRHEHFQVNYEITWDMFKGMALKHHLLLYPGYRLQKQMWKRSLGYKRWMEIHNLLGRRKRLTSYMKRHGGTMPPRTCNENSCFSKLAVCCCGPHPDDAAMLRPWGDEEQEKELARKGKKAVKLTKKDIEKVGGLQLERQMSVMEFTEGIYKGKSKRKKPLG
jgi:serine/threonine-protein phosphatase 2B regulatory subunit